MGTDLEWTFADVYEAVAETRPDAPAHLHGDRVVLWRDFDRRANALREGIRDRGADYFLLFQKSLEREGLEKTLRMSYTIFGFPDEAADEDKYLEKIFRQEAA